MAAKHTWKTLEPPDPLASTECCLRLFTIAAIPFRHFCAAKTLHSIFAGVHWHLAYLPAGPRTTPGAIRSLPTARHMVFVAFGARLVSHMPALSLFRLFSPHNITSITLCFGLDAGWIGSQVRKSQPIAEIEQVDCKRAKCPY